MNQYLYTDIYKYVRTRRCLDYIHILRIYGVLGAVAVCLKHTLLLLSPRAPSWSLLEALLGFRSYCGRSRSIGRA